MIPIRSILTIFCICALSTFFTLIIIESGMRIFVPEKYAPYQWIYNEPQNWTTDSQRIFTTTKVEQRLESLDENKSIHPVILTIGDSFTQGDPVPEADSFPATLHKNLEAAGTPNTVVNLGVGGYGPDQEFLILKKALAKGIKPDFVIWQFFANDVYENLSQPTFDIFSDNTLVQLDGTQNWIYKTISFYRALPLPTSIKEHSRTVNAFLVYSKHFEYSNVPSNKKGSWKAQETWSTKKLELEVAEAQKLADQYHFTLYPVLISSQYNYTDKPDTSVVALDWIPDSEHVLTKVLEGYQNFTLMNFNKLPTSSASAALNRDDIVNQYFDDGKRDPMPFGNRHFNEAGYSAWQKIMGEKIETELLR